MIYIVIQYFVESLSLNRTFTNYMIQCNYSIGHWKNPIIISLFVIFNFDKSLDLSRIDTNLFVLIRTIECISYIESY
jgi:hypothetical protein